MKRQLKEGLRHFLPRSLGNHRILAGPLRGSKIVTSWYDYPAAILGRTEEPLLEWFGKNVGKGETWLDVGAHYGYTAIALCKLVGHSGRVYAFEPMLNTAGCVSRMGVLNDFPQLTVIPMALGNCQDLAIDSQQAVRGMLGGWFDGHTFHPKDFKHSFLSSRLDWLWPRLSGADSQIHGIKIDVQGMEIEVLEGIVSIAKQYHPKLLVEIHGGVSRPKLLDLISSMGYLTRGFAVEPLPGETDPIYANDRTYLFTAPVPVPILA